MTTSERVVSVIVPVRNDADRLQRALNSIKVGSSPVDQIIVVDNCSTDESREIALRLADVVLEYDGSVGQCRQLGASLARNELLLFLDADQVVLENTVKRAVETLVGSGSDAVELPERPLCNQGWLMSVVAHERRYSELSGVGIPALVR
jgi:glycosyltransferase involved in cell wall biosynthesis